MPGKTEVSVVAICWPQGIHGLILVTQRAAEVHLGGFWELPGGKIRPGESPRAAARREVREEVGIRLTDLVPLLVVDHDYPDRALRIHAFLSRLDQSPASISKTVAHRWIDPLELGGVEFPPANAPITRAIQMHFGIEPVPVRIESDSPVHAPAAKAGGAEPATVEID